MPPAELIVIAALQLGLDQGSRLALILLPSVQPTPPELAIEAPRIVVLQFQTVDGQILFGVYDSLGAKVGIFSETELRDLGLAVPGEEPPTGDLEPVADFEWAPTAGDPSTIAFQDGSLGVIDSWQWDFGDGETSAVQHPRHTYAPGPYAVTLTVTEGNLTDSTTNTVTVAQPPPPSRPPEQKMTIDQFVEQMSENGRYLAFIGAEGGGRFSKGGRGGLPVEVTNLNDGGEGSYRAAVLGAGPRVVIFRTGGTAPWGPRGFIENPFLTVAGQTAPGDGFTLRTDPNGSRGDAPIIVRANNVVMRDVRSRSGADGIQGHQPGGLFIWTASARDIIFEHCDVSWSVDQTITVWSGCENVTLQDSTVTEALERSTHPKGPHSNAALIGGADGTIPPQNISLIRSLIAHARTRGPRLRDGGSSEFINNVWYNVGRGVWTNDTPAGLSVDYINNYWIPGPNHDPLYPIGLIFRTLGGSIRVHAPIGNVVAGDISAIPDVNSVDAGFIKSHQRQVAVATPLLRNGVSILSAEAAYEEVLTNVGTRVRDSVTHRIVNEVRTGTGSIIDDPSEVGGWPLLDPGTPEVDSDHDGMPDWFEQLLIDLYGAPVSPTGTPADGQMTIPGTPLTYLELYLNLLALGKELV